MIAPRETLPQLECFDCMSAAAVCLRCAKRKPCAACGELMTESRSKKYATCGGACSVARYAEIRGRTVTAENIRTLVRYDPLSGVMTRNDGRVLKSPQSTGYLCGSLNGESHLVHRLAWLYMRGEWPEYIDHINGDKTDNRMVNLRSVSMTMNNQNARQARSNSASGLLGAFPFGGRWRAQIKVNRRAIHLGVFDSAEQAHMAYVAAKRSMHEGNTL